MLTLTSGDGFLRVRANGVVSAADYAQFIPVFESHRSAARGRRLVMLLELGSTFAWTPGGLWEDVKFDIRHRNSFSRIAVIGCRQWHRPLTALAKLVLTGEVRFFRPHEEAAALQWLR
jgi:hypothetical protein